MGLAPGVGFDVEHVAPEELLPEAKQRLIDGFESTLRRASRLRAVIYELTDVGGDDLNGLFGFE